MYEHLYFNISGSKKGFKASKKEISEGWHLKSVGYLTQKLQARLWTCIPLTALPFPQAGRTMRGRLCGICGDYDGDAVKEFRKPQDNQALNGQEYASSYAVTDSKCGSRAS
jgi:hypothetical protein